MVVGVVVDLGIVGVADDGVDGDDDDEDDDNDDDDDEEQ